MRGDPEEFAGIGLRAHTLLADVPLHDVWTLDLPEGGPGRTVTDLRAALAAVDLAGSSAAVRLLFRVRTALGRLFSWDADSAPPRGESFVERLSPEERRSSLVPPGTQEGPFRIVFASEREAISEIRNATVHAFSVFALSERPVGYRLYWAIYVKPVGRITGFYMRLIDPFRRLLVYPAVLRRIRSAWTEHVSSQARIGRPGGSL